MALVRNMNADTSLSNRIDLTWDLPLGFNNTTDEIIVTRTQSHFPVELFNDATVQCSLKATDSRPIEIFRGKTIVGTDIDSISVLSNVLTDTKATFSINPSLKGRLLRDTSSQVFVIESNTATSITVQESSAILQSGKYAVLAHFPCITTVQRNFEFDGRTTAGAGFVSNLVEMQAASALLAVFTEDEVATLVFRDNNDERFFIKSNTVDTIFLFEKQSFLNTGLETFTYTIGTGVIQFGGIVDLSNVKAGHTFIDSAGLENIILGVNDGANTVTLNINLTIDSTTPTEESQGSVSIIPVIGPIMSIFPSFVNTSPFPYADTYKIPSEAAARIGTGLVDDQFYYYTAFNKPEGANVAQAKFSNIDAGTSTQVFALSTKDKDFGTLLFELFPGVYKDLDATGDLEDLMEVFGFQLNEIHSLITNFTLQDPDKVLSTALQPLSEQTGLPTVGLSIGADTLRRIGRDLISAWKLKGSKEGIALFIRILTTWDITNGTADFSVAVEDFLPNVDALRLFDPNLGSLNTRITNSNPIFIAGGRFAQTLPGVVIPGFFSFREFVINLPNIALYIGDSELLTLADGTTTMIDTANNFGANNALVGNFLLPNTEEVNDIFEIVASTATSITVRGTISNRNPGGDYVILSPLNINRFIILNRLLPLYTPFGTKAGFRFICD